MRMNWSVIVGIGVVALTAGVIYYFSRKQVKNPVRDDLTLILLEKLQEAAKRKKFIVVHLYWNNSGSNSVNLSSLKRDDSFVIVEIPWRAAVSKADYYNYRDYPINRAYILFEAMVWEKKQSLGRVSLKELRSGSGDTSIKDPVKRTELPVETYSNYSAEEFPIFPQVFILDSRKLDQGALSKLISSYKSGYLFEPDAHLHRLSTSHQIPQNRFGLAAFRAQFQTRALDLLERVVGEHGVIVQLLNENLFQEKNQNFHKAEFDRLVNYIKKLYNITNVETKWIYPVFDRGHSSG